MNTDASTNLNIPLQAIRGLAATAFVHKNADDVACAHLIGLSLISSRFDAGSSSYALAYTTADGVRHEYEHFTDLDGDALQFVADFLDHGDAMPSGFEIVSRTEISPPGSVFKFVANGVAHRARNPAAEQVVVRVMGVKYSFVREVV